MLVAAHAAAELVQVGQAVVVGLVDEDRVGVGDVEPALDDRRGHQQVGLAGRRSRASPLPAASSSIWPWAMPMRASGTIAGSRSASVLDVVDAVVDEEDLPAAVQLAQDGLADQLGVEAADAGLDRQAVVAAASPGSRCRGCPAATGAACAGSAWRVIVSTSTVLPQRLEPLLRVDAEPLLLVDDHQPQVLEADVVLHQPVRADDDVDSPVCQSLRASRFCWPSGAEPREHVRSLKGNSAIRSRNVR